MTTVFIAGSISINYLHEKVKEKIKDFIGEDYKIVVGDANGVDTSVQKLLNNYNADNVLVYCTGDYPRNNVAEWPVHNVYSKAKANTKAYFTAKDLEMAHHSDLGLMIWDCKSTGTLSNVVELLKENKKSFVFIEKVKSFLLVEDKKSFYKLISCMSEDARSKAEEKVKFTYKLSKLNDEQLALYSEESPIKEKGHFDYKDEVDKFISKQHSKHLEREPLKVYGKNLSTPSKKLRSDILSKLKGYVDNTVSYNGRKVGSWHDINDIIESEEEKENSIELDTLIDVATAAGFEIRINFSGE